MTMLVVGVAAVLLGFIISTSRLRPEALVDVDDFLVRFLSAKVHVPIAICSARGSTVVAIRRMGLVDSTSSVVGLGVNIATATLESALKTLPLVFPSFSGLWSSASTVSSGLVLTVIPVEAGILAKTVILVNTCTSRVDGPTSGKHIVFLVKTNVTTVVDAILIVARKDVLVACKAVRGAALTAILANHLLRSHLRCGCLGVRSGYSWAVVSLVRRGSEVLILSLVTSWSDGDVMIEFSNVRSRARSGL
ncbi:hypothetical protein QBC35DRAFT_47427 [Podospora australis]|uniref:Uncharacterized protein n=1 Tax=Podospora australis TaxID=1536484 RepID=A0AAN6WNL0_9PEZI|nr:hypothetical protein QBC35DRAFT_47427 [Podospora australis]